MNIKTFSAIKDIDPKIHVRLTVGSITENGFPYCKIVCNGDELYADQLIDDYVIEFDLNILTPVNVQITMSDKIYDQHKETAVIIKEFFIDHIDIAKDYQYHADYVNDHNINCATAYLGWNGTWNFDTKIPFYQWLHHASKQGWLLQPCRL
jgi:hypothetical protein